MFVAKFTLPGIDYIQLITDFSPEGHLGISAATV
jgi:hypothetical protein